MTKKFHGGYALSVKEISLIINTSMQTAREKIKAWKLEQGLQEKAYFTVYHLSIALLVPVIQLVESLTSIYS